MADEEDVEPPIEDPVLVFADQIGLGQALEATADPGHALMDIFGNFSGRAESCVAFFGVASRHAVETSDNLPIEAVEDQVTVGPVIRRQR